MPYKFNPLLDIKLDYYTKETGSSGGTGYITNLSLVFCESFTGDGGTTDFTLTGIVENAVFGTGVWLLQRVETTLPSHATTDGNAALYDSSNIFTKNRIQVLAINSSTGEVTLNYPPQFLEEFKVWYWYTLRTLDVLESYYREEFVASMEGDISAGDLIAAQNVSLDTTDFDTILSPTEDTVQKAMDVLDDHIHGTAITDTLIEDLDLDSFLIGYAIDNAGINDPLWQIKKVVETVSEEIEFYYADGSENFDKTWANRSSYTYN